MTRQRTGGATVGEAAGRGAAGHDAASDREKRLTLVAAIMGSFVVGVDATVVNVALPAIGDDLGGGLAGQQWVVNAYLLTLGSLLLIGGSLGDLFGERRVFVLGVGAFGAVSAACAAAPTIEVLVVARALQGVAGALLTPAALAVIVSTFTTEERGGAIGSWTAWSGIAAVIGPLAGGQLIDIGSWRWIFAVNVPFVLVTLALARAIPRAEEGREHARVDVIGAFLCALGLAGPVFALIEQPRLGWGDPAVYLPLVIGVALLAGFLVYESRASHPMLSLSLFRSRNFSFGNAETLVMYGGLSIVFFFLVIFLQQVAGYSALEAGFATLPSTVVMFLMSRRFGKLADRLGPRLFMGVGPLVGAGGLALMVRLDENVSYFTDLMPALIIFSVGLAMTVAPLTATVLAGADEHNAGIASGVNNAIARVAGLLSTAAIGALVAGQFGASLDERLSDRPLSPEGRTAVERARDRPLSRIDTPELGAEERDALAAASTGASVSAFRLAMGAGAGMLALGGLLGLAGIRDPRRREVRAEHCPGGSLAGAPRDAARHRRRLGLESPGAAAAESVRVDGTFGGQH